MTPADLSLPSPDKLLREGPAIARLVAAQFRLLPVRSHPVRTAPTMVLPGLLTGDFHTGVLRRAIVACGGQAFGWGQGLNTGATCDKFARLLARVERLSREAGEPLVLVGWSLGGLYARELAKRLPDRVAMVVTLGTPFSHGPGRNHAKPIYDLINDHDADHPPIADHPGRKPAAFTVACWSRQDGIVAPLCAAGEDHQVDVRVELRCTHHEMVSDPQAVRTIIAILRAERTLRRLPGDRPAPVLASEATVGQALVAASD